MSTCHDSPHRDDNLPGQLSGTLAQQQIADVADYVTGTITK
jgi:hypothetical protein